MGADDRRFLYGSGNGALGFFSSAPSPRSSSEHDAPMFSDVSELKWNGRTEKFAAVAVQIGDDRIAARAEKALEADVLLGSK